MHVQLRVVIDRILKLLRHVFIAGGNLAIKRRSTLPRWCLLHIGHVWVQVLHSNIRLALHWWHSVLHIGLVFRGIHFYWNVRIYIFYLVLWWCLWKMHGLPHRRVTGRVLRLVHLLSCRCSDEIHNLV